MHSRLMIEFLWTINCPILYGAISVVGPKWGGGDRNMLPRMIDGVFLGKWAYGDETSSDRARILY